MSDIERLDFSKPPPGYEVIFVRRMGNFGEAVGFWWRCGAAWSAGHFDNEPEALAAAWAHHKARHDPPGMLSWVAALRRHLGVEGRGCHIRPHAWAWYEDAVEVADLLDGENGPAETWPERCAWPRPLTWTAEQRTEVRQWSADGGLVAGWAPEVLRGL